jgi:hypothetical protein
MIFWSYFKTCFLAVKGQQQQQQQQQDGRPPAEHISDSLLSNFILLVLSSGPVTVQLCGSLDLQFTPSSGTYPDSSGMSRALGADRTVCELPFSRRWPDN